VQKKPQKNQLKKQKQKKPLKLKKLHSQSKPPQIISEAVFLSNNYSIFLLPIQSKPSIASGFNRRIQITIILQKSINEIIMIIANQSINNIDQKQYSIR
jgi:hypothetical protein